MLISAGEDLPTTPEQLLPPDVAARLDRLDVVTRRVLSGRTPGDRSSKRRGQSIEFDDFRDYAPGDDLRHLDWTILARFDRLMIKVFRAELDLTVHLVLDTTRSMLAGRPSKLATSARVVAALAAMLLARQNRVAVSTVDGGGRPSQLGGLRGRPAIGRAMSFLCDRLSAVREASVGAGAGGDPEAVARGLRRLLGADPARGVVILASDLLTPGDPEAILNCLSGPTGFEGHVLHAVAEEERALDRGVAGLTGDLRLVDAETGAWREVTITPEAAAAHAGRVEAYIERVRRGCAARSIRHVLLSNRSGPSEALSSLRRAGTLG